VSPFYQSNSCAGSSFMVLFLLHDIGKVVNSRNSRLLSILDSCHWLASEINVFVIANFKSEWSDGWLSKHHVVNNMSKP
jgi:predicted deacetylase